MIIDQQLVLSDAQAVTAAAASTNYINFSAARNLGVGASLYVVVSCVVAMTDSGSDSTLAVALETDTTTSFTPDATRTLFTFAALAAAGTTKIARLGPDDINMQYARLYYTPANGNLSAGSFTAFICESADINTLYPDALVIS